MKALIAAALLIVQVRAASAQAPNLDAAIKEGSTMPRLHSLLVSWRGNLVLERYSTARNLRARQISSLHRRA